MKPTLDTIDKLHEAITTVAESTDQSFEDVVKKLMAEDNWTWFLVKQCAQ